MGIRSMTGYGRAQLQESGVQLSIELLAVNRKHLDINLIMPRHLVRFDPEIRKALGGAIFRGHVTMRLSAAFTGESPLMVRPNLALAKQLYKGWQEIAESVSEQKLLSLSLLEREPDLFIYEETSQMERLSELIHKGIEEALKPFLAMRLKEGEALARDISQRLALLRTKMQSIQTQSHLATNKYRQKLIDKMREVLPTADLSDERLLKEIALFAEKVDIEEEIVRFFSHLEQFNALLLSDQVVGKTAEFLVQELGREINTIGSKSNEIALTKIVVDIKAELERIREQIQNIE